MNNIRSNFSKLQLYESDVNSTIQDFIIAHPNSIKYDIIQSTFALQSLNPNSRREVLKWISKHSNRFLLVEFDVSNVFRQENYSVERIQFIIDKIEKGLQEYKKTSVFNEVSQGFLIPVMIGYFDQNDKNRTNYEQVRI